MSPYKQILNEEQFILRVTPSIAERIELLLSENASSSENNSLDLSFSENGKTGTFSIGDERFSTCLLKLPCNVESYKTYDDNVLIKTADIGQMIMVTEDVDNPYDDNGMIKTADIGQMIMVTEDVDYPTEAVYKHGLTPPMRDAKNRRFRREPNLKIEESNHQTGVSNREKVIEKVKEVEKDLINIMAGGTVEAADVKVTEQEEDSDGNARGANKEDVPKPAEKPDAQEAGPADREPDTTDSDSDISI